jgi:hypothetical protein
MLFLNPFAFSYGSEIINDLRLRGGEATNRKG